MSTRRRARLALIAAALVLAALARPGHGTEGVPELLQQTYWGENSGALLRQFSSAAMRLPNSLGFRRRLPDLVLNGKTLGGVLVVVFFQMDKRTHAGYWSDRLPRPLLMMIACWLFLLTSYPAFYLIAGWPSLATLGAARL